MLKSERLKVLLPIVELLKRYNFFNFHYALIEVSNQPFNKWPYYQNV